MLALSLRRHRDHPRSSDVGLLSLHLDHVLLIIGFIQFLIRAHSILSVINVVVLGVRHVWVAVVLVSEISQLPLLRRLLILDLYDAVIVLMDHVDLQISLAI